MKQLNQDEEKVMSVKTDISETFLSQFGKETIKSDIADANATFQGSVENNRSVVLRTMEM
jgi:hypothetical protein